MPQVLLSTCENPNPDEFSPLITVLACNGSQECIVELLRSGCDPLKSYHVDLDDATRSVDTCSDKRPEIASNLKSASAAKLPVTSYQEAVAVGAMKPVKVEAASHAVSFHPRPAASAASRGSGVGGMRVCCALDAAAYYGMLPAFKFLLQACKKRLTLLHCKSCAAAAAATDQLSIIQHLNEEVISDPDDLFWPEAAAVAAASDHCMSLQYLMSSSRRSWMLPLNCSLSPCARSNVLHVAASHRSHRVLIACCNLARVSQPSSLSLAAAKLLDPWGQLFRSTDSNGCTALHVAVCSGCSVVAMSALVSCAKDTLNEKDNKGRSALHIASGELQLSSVKALLSMGADFLAKDGCGQSAAHVAVAACSLQQAQHTDPNVCASLQQRCLDIIKCLFEQSQNAALPAASVAASASSLMSESASAGDPLVVAAARSGLHDVVAYLLDMDRSCVHSKGRRGDSVLDLYLSTKSSSGLDLLQQRGLMSAMDYASAPRRNAGFNPAHTLKPFWQARR